MKILMISPYPVWPVESGGASRTYNIAKALSLSGHELMLLHSSERTSDSDATDKINWFSYEHKGVMGHFINFSFLSAYKHLLKNNIIDLIILEGPFQAFMVLRKAKKSGIPVIYDAHNVEQDRFVSMGKKSIAKLVGLSEGYLAKGAAKIVSVSNEDKDVFVKRYHKTVDVLPNGVDLETFYFAEPKAELIDSLNLKQKKIVLYFGAFDYSPNVEALEFLIKETWPILTKKIDNACLLVVGKKPPVWLKSTDNIQVMGLVDNIIDYIQLADVVAVPLFSGGGSRLKIIEALACGKVVLSTEFGAMGFLEHSGDGLKITDHKSFTSELTDFLRLDNQGVNKNSRQIAENYGWKALVDKVQWDCSPPES